MTQVKLVRTKVCLTRDISTFIGYEYYLCKIDENARHLLYSTLFLKDPKNTVLHDEEAHRLCLALVENQKRQQNIEHDSCQKQKMIFDPANKENCRPDRTRSF